MVGGVDRRHRIENLRRSVAMLSPGQMALDRDKACRLLDRLHDLEVWSMRFSGSSTTSTTGTPATPAAAVPGRAERKPAHAPRAEAAGTLQNGSLGPLTISGPSSPTANTAPHEGHVWNGRSPASTSRSAKSPSVQIGHTG